MHKVKIYTDGACSGNPGPGGWGAILLCGDQEKLLSGGDKMTTNNRMELMGVISGLMAIKSMCEIEVYSDSKYVIDGIKSWIHGWKKNGWKNSQKKDVINSDLWKQLDDLVYNKYKDYKISWHWVKGHGTDYYNNKADALAREGAVKF